MSKNLEIPAFKSCLPQEPFIKYGSGPATEIAPNLPQTNEFSAYGILPVEVSPSAFKTGVVPPPVDPFFAEITALKVGTADEIKAKIATKLRGLFGTYIKPKNFPVAGTEKIVDPAWVAAANYSAPVQYIYVQKMIDNFVDYMGDMPFSEVVDKVNTEGVKPVVSLNYAQQALVAFVKPVTTTTPAVPNLFVVEEYRMAAYLGKYGMGRVVKTFTLLPGEKTTITVKTYKDTTKTQSRSENVLDSYSESSANDLENLVQDEQENKTENKRSTDFTGALSFSGASKFLSGVSASAALTTKNESTRGSLVKNLNRALEKHVNNSNSNRQIQVNTTTTETTKEGEESATVRELVNLNKSRVLNFVFRQLHQQYITVTYLSDIKIAFTNGYDADARLVSLEELRGLLTSVLNPASIDAVERNILKNYCIVRDYKDAENAFIEKKTWQIGTCADLPTIAVSASATPTPAAPPPAVALESFTFWRKKKDLVGTVPASVYGFPMSVPGIILSVKESTLKTSSVLAEAMLGQADALDCFNLKIQDAEAQKGYIENTERLTRLQNEEWKARHDRAKQQQEIDLMKLQMKIVSDIPDPIQRAEMYKKIFGTCCDTPQTVIQH
jgi:hypothetical protein